MEAEKVQNCQVKPTKLGRPSTRYQHLHHPKEVIYRAEKLPGRRYTLSMTEDRKKRKTDWVESGFSYSSSKPRGYHQGLKQLSVQKICLQRSYQYETLSTLPQPKPTALPLRERVMTAWDKTLDSKNIPLSNSNRALASLYGSKISELVCGVARPIFHMIGANEQCSFNSKGVEARVDSRGKQGDNFYENKKKM